MSSIVQKLIMIRFTNIDRSKVVNLNVAKIHDISEIEIKGEKTYWISTATQSYQLCVAEYERILKQYCYVSEVNYKNINIQIGE